MNEPERGRVAPCALALAAGLLAATAGAQPVIAPIEDVDFDRPEAWAMKFFTSVSLQTSLGPVVALEPGTIDLGFEVVAVPHLDTEQRTVGFNGSKEENLNRAPAWGRLRASFGLPAKWTLYLGWVPPVEVDGVEANLFSLGIGRPVWQAERWGLGARLHGQLGDAQGDLTCSPEDLVAPPGESGNEFGCEAVSSDTVNLEYVGAELVASYRFTKPKLPVLHFGASANYMDLEFEVNALTFGFIDRTRLLTDGWTYSVTAGSTWALGERYHLAAELFYSPLDVLRRGQTSSENDALFTVRGMIRYRVR